MVQCVRMLLVTAVAAVSTAPASATPPAQQEQPFEAVHLLWVNTQRPGAEAQLRAAVLRLNEAVRQAGCSACTYHLWRVTGTTPDSYNYVQRSEWPDEATYERIHHSPEYLAATQAWAALRSVVMREVYLRQSEVPLDESPGIVAALTSNTLSRTSDR